MKMASDSVKKVTLELGGKSANIILDDADIDLAVNGHASEPSSIKARSANREHVSSSLLKFMTSLLRR